jgi:hypothetical protein
MRLLQACLIAAALLAPAAAQAQSAYDYPWCAVYSGKRGAMSCYYASYAQCMLTISGIGGTCIESPYYGHGPNQRAHRREYRNY